MPHIGQADQDTYSDEWYTPRSTIEAAREVLGAIDLDPASNPEANLTVRAAQYFTRQDNGLSRQWFGRMWLNPPYSQSQQWVTRLLNDYENRKVEAAVLLVNAWTDVRWFRPLWAYPICMRAGRTKFYGPGGNPEGENGVGGASAIIYLGPLPGDFRRAFCRIGPIVMRTENHDRLEWCKECRRTSINMEYEANLSNPEFPRCHHCKARF